MNLLDPHNTIAPDTLETVTGGQNFSETVGLPPNWQPSTTIDRLAWKAADKGLQLWRNWRNPTPTAPANQPTDR